MPSAQQDISKGLRQRHTSRHRTGSCVDPLVPRPFVPSRVPYSLIRRIDP